MHVRHNVEMDTVFRLKNSVMMEILSIGMDVTQFARMKLDGYVMQLSRNFGLSQTLNVLVMKYVEMEE